jgi:hypothetical protein
MDLTSYPVLVSPDDIDRKPALRLLGTVRLQRNLRCAEQGKVEQLKRPMTNALMRSEQMT